MLILSRASPAPLAGLGLSSPLVRPGIIPDPLQACLPDAFLP
jgi:hypothetical protein